MPVVFSDFELVLPRLDAVDEATGRFDLQPSATLFLDKRPTAQIGGLQEYSKVDHRTNKVHLGPRESDVDYFDLEALLPEGWTDLDWGQATEYANKFTPILRFRDSFGNEYHCDKEGAHWGVYVYPLDEALDREFPRRKWAHTLMAKKRRGVGWSHAEVAHPRALTN